MPLALLAAAVFAVSATAAEEAASVEARLSQTVGYLASDELEGRGVGTRGLDLAAYYLAAEFTRLGLDTSLYDGTPFQNFKMTTGTKLGESNHAALIGPPAAEGDEPRSIQLELGRDFNPLAVGGSAAFDLPLVFVGYGITAPDEGYDDYAGIDVEGKAVIILRHEPQQDNPHSVFDGTRNSAYAPFTRKLSNAYEHGAAAVVFCTDEHEIRDKVADRSRRYQAALEELAKLHDEFRQHEQPSMKQIAQFQEQVDELLEQVRRQGERLAAEFDPVLDFNRAGTGEAQRDLPVIHCRRGVLDEIFRAALDTGLAALERAIDEAENGPTPHSRELSGWRLAGEVTVERTEASVKNVIAVLEGEGPSAKETIVIGAHYDHLGWGGPGSFVPDQEVIHNGADDNGSGTAALLEIARQLATRGKKLPRRVVFIAFTGEERGLVGSARYVGEPLVPMENTVAMLNMDMVGRLSDNKLIIQGVDTSPQFTSIIDELNEKYGFEITRQTGGFGPSDHSSFYAKKVPVMHFFTGTHPDYHRPTDDTEKLNLEGMRKITDMVAETAIALAEAPQRPEYVAVARSRPRDVAGDRPYFGSIPDFAQDKPGYKLTGVTEDGPAAKAGIQAGDVIIKLADSKIGNLEDFDSALRKHKAGDKVPVTIQRGNEELTVEVLLDEPR